MTNNRLLKFTIQDTDKKIVRKFLSSQNFSSSQVRNLKNKGGKIYVNHKERHLDFKIKTGDSLLVVLNEEIPADIIEPRKGELDVIYEDDYLLVVNKPPHLASLPARDRTSTTMANIVKYYLEEKGENSTIHLVTRLDRDTSGLMVFAKNSYTHSLLDQILHSQDFQKFYLAIIYGKMKPSLGLIDLPIGIDPNAFYLRTIDQQSGKISKTEYETLETYEDASLLRLKLLTGRTHQIRVHLSAVGHAIIGDEMYSHIKDPRISRQALHCYELLIIHPVTHELLKLKAPIPQDMVLLRGAVKG